MTNPFLLESIGVYDVQVHVEARASVNWMYPPKDEEERIKRERIKLFVDKAASDLEPTVYTMLINSILP